MTREEALKIIKTELPYRKDPYGCTEEGNHGKYICCLDRSCNWTDALKVIEAAMKKLDAFEEQEGMEKQKIRVTRMIDADALMNEFPCTCSCKNCGLSKDGFLPCDIKDKIKAMLKEGDGK